MLLFNFDTLHWLWDSCQSIFCFFFFFFYYSDLRLVLVALWGILRLESVTESETRESQSEHITCVCNSAAFMAFIFSSVRRFSPGRRRFSYVIYVYDFPRGSWPPFNSDTWMIFLLPNVRENRRERDVCQWDRDANL